MEAPGIWIVVATAPTNVPPETEDTISASQGSPSRFVITSLAGFVTLWPLVAMSAPTETVLYNFGPRSGTSPTAPLGGVTLDAAGNIYGTTEFGGMYKRGASYQGTVYELSPAGQLTVLKNLQGGSAFPQSGVTRDARGNLYGTTYGQNGFNRTNAEGSLFAVYPGGYFEQDVFPNETTGPAYPQSSPLIGNDGNLYDTSPYGGTYSGGTLFKVLPNGTVSVLHSFGATEFDASYPAIGTLTSDTEGNFYGATSGGGTFGEGTIYKIDPMGTETILYDGYLLSGDSDACAYPNAGLVRDAAGNLYGTTAGGGGDYGCIFQLTPAGVFNIIYAFPYIFNEEPVPNGGLVRDAAGNLFGTAQVAGAYYQGSVFELTASGVFRTLYSFTGGADGGKPTYGVTFDGRGNLYGTANTGGSNGGGVVFKITP